jgi:hypothetical protein
MMKRGKARAQKAADVVQSGGRIEVRSREGVGGGSSDVSKIALHLSNRSGSGVRSLGAKLVNVSRAVSNEG